MTVVIYCPLCEEANKVKSIKINRNTQTTKQSPAGRQAVVVAKKPAKTYSDWKEYAEHIKAKHPKDKERLEWATTSLAEAKEREELKKNVYRPRYRKYGPSGGSGGDSVSANIAKVGEG